MIYIGQYEVDLKDFVHLKEVLFSYLSTLQVLMVLMMIDKWEINNN